MIHLGAGLAAADRAADGSLELGDLRLAFAGGVDDPGVADLGRILEPASFTVMAGLSTWPGEGEEWRPLGVPIISFVGGFTRFHTADDRAAAVTSGALLARVHRAVLDACRRLVTSG